jgi:hypothetical protein
MIAKGVKSTKAKEPREILRRKSNQVEEKKEIGWEIGSLILGEQQYSSFEHKRCQSRACRGPENHVKSSQDRRHKRKWRSTESEEQLTSNASIR